MAFIPDEAIRSMNELSAGAWRLYCFLACCRNSKTGKCFPSLQTTMAAIEANRGHVFKLRGELKEKGWATFSGDSAILIKGFESLKNQTSGEVEEEVKRPINVQSLKIETSPKYQTTESENSDQEVRKIGLESPKIETLSLHEPVKEPVKLTRERESNSSNGRARSLDRFENAPTSPRNDLVADMTPSMRLLAQLCNFHPDLITPLQFSSLKVQAERLEKARGFTEAVLGRFRDYWEGKLAKRAPLKPEYVTEHFGNYLVWLQSNGTSNGYHP